MSISGSKNAAKMWQGPIDHRQHNEGHYFEDIINDPSCKVTVTETEIIIKAPDYATYVVAKFKIKEAAAVTGKPVRGRYGDINAQ